eukprot:987605-Pelagomonas_calceolata.AAC.1
MPTELVDRIWQSKRLPVLVDEAVKQVTSSMVTLEARFLQRMREEQAAFASEIAAATERTLVRAAEGAWLHHVQSIDRQCVLVRACD